MRDAQRSPSRTSPGSGGARTTWSGPKRSSGSSPHIRTENAGYPVDRRNRRGRRVLTRFSQLAQRHGRSTHRRSHVSIQHVPRGPAEVGCGSFLCHGPGKTAIAGRIVPELPESPSSYVFHPTAGRGILRLAEPDLPAGQRCDGPDRCDRLTDLRIRSCPLDAHRSVPARRRVRV